MPTLIGAEYTFTFQNMNIERGLLWNQEPAISRGAQLNYTADPLAFSFSWNDGFYSNQFTWLTGSLAYTLDKAEHLHHRCRRQLCPFHQSNDYDALQFNDSHTVVSEQRDDFERYLYL